MSRALMRHRRVVILLLLVALLVATAASDPVHVAVGRILESAKTVIRAHEVLGLALFVVLSAVSAVLFFFSTALIVPVAVYSWGKPTTILLLWGSWLLGATMSYAIGRHPGRRLAKWLVPEEHVVMYEEKLSGASFPLVLLFQLAVPSEIPGLVLGALRYHFGKYLGARAIAELPFAIGTVYLGDTFVRRQYLPLIAIAVGAIILTTAALHFLHRRIER